MTDPHQEPAVGQELEQQNPSIPWKLHNSGAVNVRPKLTDDQRSNLRIASLTVFDGKV